jgi:hypothetical protein
MQSADGLRIELHVAGVAKKVCVMRSQVERVIRAMRRAEVLSVRRNDPRHERRHDGLRADRLR